MQWRPGYLAIRALGRARWMLAAVPASAYIAFATLGLAFIPLAGKTWAPLSAFASFMLGAWSICRMIRRQRALSWQAWKP
jgi:hypothetical protein